MSKIRIKLNNEYSIKAGISSGNPIRVIVAPNSSVIKTNYTLSGISTY